MQHEPGKVTWLIAGIEWSSFIYLLNDFWRDLAKANSQYIWKESPCSPQPNVRTKAKAPVLLLFLISKAIQNSHHDFNWRAMTTSCCGRPPQLRYPPLQMEVSLSHHFIQSLTHSALIHSSSYNTQLNIPMKFTRNNPFKYLTHRLVFLQYVTSHLV